MIEIMFQGEEIDVCGLWQESSESPVLGLDTSVFSYFTLECFYGDNDLAVFTPDEGVVVLNSSNIFNREAIRKSQLFEVASQKLVTFNGDSRW